MRTAFFGTPAIAVPSLFALADTTDLVGVVCQPDKPAGRGLKPHACAVKQAAAELGVEVHQPMKVKTGTLHEWLSERGVDLAVVLAYGRILPEATLRAPRFGCVNLHASLLPKYRGAAPLNWAIANRERQTGVSLMLMEEGLDTGPVFSQRAIPLDPDATAGSLALQLGELAATMVRTDLHLISDGVKPSPQDPTQASHARPLSSSDGEICWSDPAEDIEARVRAFTPRPGAYTFMRDARVKVHHLSFTDVAVAGVDPPGTILVGPKRRLFVQTGTVPLEVLQAQWPGKKVASGTDLLNGRLLEPGSTLGR